VEEEEASSWAKMAFGSDIPYDATLGKEVEAAALMDTRVVKR
jgi:hypothetical protein